MCLGKRFAEIEASITLFMLLRRFKFEFCGKIADDRFSRLSGLNVINFPFKITPITAK
jgi:cytochrome P450